jgi:hypothetical protein
LVIIAWAFGLNQIASQIGLHAVAPLHLLLFLPFIEVGVYLFHTRRLALSRQQSERLSHHPLRLFHEIWQWEWHALVVWVWWRDHDASSCPLSSPGAGLVHAASQNAGSFVNRQLPSKM